MPVLIFNYQKPDKSALSATWHEQQLCKHPLLPDNRSATIPVLAPIFQRRGDLRRFAVPAVQTSNNMLVEWKAAGRVVDRVAGAEFPFVAEREPVAVLFWLDLVRAGENELNNEAFGYSHVWDLGGEHLGGYEADEVSKFEVGYTGQDRGVCGHQECCEDGVVFFCYFVVC